MKLKNSKKLKDVFLTDKLLDSTILTVFELYTTEIVRKIFKNCVMSQQLSIWKNQMCQIQLYMSAGKSALYLYP